jgi:tetratricopeptide (TPR) repeat protein
MRLAAGFGNGSRLSVRIVERIEPRLGVGLKDPRIAGKMLLRMNAGAIPRIEEHGRRRCSPAKGTVITHIGPNPSGVALRFRQHRNRGVVAMKALSGEHMRLDEFMERHQRRRAGADMIRHGRHRQLHSLARLLFALPVERLMIGVFLHQHHRQQAWAACRRAVIIKPDYAEAYCSLGNALRDQGKFEEAVAASRRAVAIKPNHAVAYSILGIALQKQGKLDEAVAACHQALAIKPDYAEAHSILGTALQMQDKLDEAVVAHHRAIGFKPDSAELHSNLGVALQGQGKLDEAVAASRRAIAIKPDYAVVHCNLGVALHGQSKLDEAVAAHRQALRLKPDYPEAHSNLASVLLLLGRYDEGWSNYEWRWDVADFPSKRLNFATWRGEDLNGRRLLVFCEQGMDDIIQFARYLPLLAKNPCLVTFLAVAKLTRLLRPLTSGIELISALDAERKFDFQCAMMSLPHRLGTDLGSIPNTVPYLRAEDALVAHWRERIGAHGFKIGIAWHGNPKAKINRERSFPLAEYFTLARFPALG